MIIEAAPCGSSWYSSNSQSRSDCHDQPPDERQDVLCGSATPHRYARNNGGAQVTTGIRAESERS